MASSKPTSTASVVKIYLGPSDVTFAIAARQMNDVRKYYDSVFKFCIRRDKVLSRYLDKDLKGFDSAETNTMDIARVDTNATQPAIMVEPQSKMEWLLSIAVLTTSFERTFT